MKTVCSGLRRALPILATAIATTALAGEIPPGTDYGGGVAGAEIVSVDAVVSDPERFAGRPIVVHGRISDVCERRGCWTVLRGEHEQMRVLHGDHDFSLPADCRGQQAFAEGAIEIRKASRREIDHYASESRSGDIPEAGNPERSVRLTATGVRLVERGD
jgi:hypothetical protein